MSGPRSTALLDLGSFLRAQQRRGFSWADGHCLALPADWMVLNGLPDPAGPWRGSVTDEAGARAALAAAGGIERFAAEAMGPTGAPPIPTHAVRRGDVGLVWVIGPDGPGMAGGIRTEGRWAVRSPRGLWIGRGDCVAAWRVEAAREV